MLTLPNLIFFHILLIVICQLDDALSATRLQDGRIKIWIHVADPTRLVQPGSILDRLSLETLKA